ncbi:D-alanine--D-alanine ligase family protein [Alkaliphilus sp. B6464]|uniref:D-alanine--D-alanine ligase family protein n=1 Tax=Alkaliphilus sp. B6464 TaxID=2731219 RepID=UPI001BA516B4|nr:D-alanine--D-alanine ligase family protein [Alkaliphilus sp. B6464]QUH21574.1 D-alanine--D-alanine ligase [Alkaliphilus sp. B6464]
MNVMVIFGGKSGEHEVSLMSATSILRAMNKDKYNIITVGITKEGVWKLYEGPIDEIQSGAWEKTADEGSENAGLNTHMSLLPTEKGNGMIAFGNGRIEKVDVVFPVLHGPFGEDGTIQGLFEMINIPYVGTGVLASSVAMDKAISKKLLQVDSIPQAKYGVVMFKEYKKDKMEVISKIEAKFKYPIFVKPANMGSSVGITKANTREKLKEAIELAGEYDRKIVIEETIIGKEIECSVLGNDDPIASLPAEIIPSAEFYDYNDKYFAGTSKFVIPANLPESILNEVRDMAIRVYKLLDCSGLSRVDFFVESTTNRVLLNEVNTMPGFTKISMYPKMWEATGIKYEDLIDRLIELAIERFNERAN